MKIAFVDLSNFRRLKACRIEFADEQILFVGANNSGKTSAMDALIAFFKSKKFSPRDFTLSNWTAINEICKKWENEPGTAEATLLMKTWEDLLPTLDFWIIVEHSEVHYVTQLIPTLDWSGGLLGVRLRFEPDLKRLFKDYREEVAAKESLLKNEKAVGKKYNLWPKNMFDFLDKGENLSGYFELKAYVLDPAVAEKPVELPANAEPLEKTVIENLIRIDIINAQRGFSDVNADTEDKSANRSLSSQLRSYYERHLNPDAKPTANDLDALEAIDSARELFDKNLMESFQISLGELEGLNYPGFNNPKIILSSRFNMADSLNHDAAVRYSLADDGLLNLPERYNGLGYQNLISMIFKLIRFRDDWMRVGKSKLTGKHESEVEPLHLVLIEEPEAHLHAQVQQVFIKEAYKVLRNHQHLTSSNTFSTQLIISTHSSHIVHESDFKALRYFQRKEPDKSGVGTSQVINLSTVFGSEDQTTRFAIRYLKTTHCDIFFADAVILVEGPAEKMLIPYFIKYFSQLNVCYLSVLEINGSHAHTLRPLIEKLRILTVVITDLDSINPKDNNKKVRPEKGKDYLTGNDSLKTWLPIESSLDTLMDLAVERKIDQNFPVKVCYQIPVTINGVTVQPYTLEDSIVMENRELFRGMGDAKSLLKKMIEAANINEVDKSAQAMYDAINASGAKKAEFALELLFLKDPDKVKTPLYIKEGLEWLETKLIDQKQILTSQPTNL